MAKKILVVDSSAITRQSVELVLAREGYSVVLAVDGLDALKKMAEEEIDLIITEIGMPNLDGVSLVKEIRKTEKNINTPVVMLTIEGGESVKRRMLALGDVEWITKPIKARRLLSVVEDSFTSM